MGTVVVPRGAGSQFGHQCWTRCLRGVLWLWKWTAPGLRGPVVAGAAAFVVRFSQVKIREEEGLEREPAARIRGAAFRPALTPRCVNSASSCCVS